jgi:transposase
MAMYCGIDLHSNNNYVAIQDGRHEDVVCRRLRNDLGAVLEFLEPYREELEAVAVESTFNWYWLVDGLKEAGYDVRLMNTTKARDYSRKKYTDDRHDARWIAHLLALGILPEGYIMPRQERGLRDLLRRRSFLVHQRTSLYLSVKTIFARSKCQNVTIQDVLSWDSDSVRKMFDDPNVAESVAVMLPVVRVVTAQIKGIEKIALQAGKLRDEFRLLLTAPGIGDVLALTIMCETGDIGRFRKVGNYGSYCRCVKSEKFSNRKKKGKGNRKNGNKYLSWAYSEAAHHAKQYEPLAKRYFDRKRSRSHPMVAARALANKMARACYYVMRDQVPFDTSRTFC